MAGLSMAQLNNLLATYIKTVREMENQVVSSSSPSPNTLYNVPLEIVGGVELFFGSDTLSKAL